MKSTAKHEQSAERATAKPKTLAAPYGQPEEATPGAVSLQGLRSIFHKVGRSINARVSVGTVILPLHGTTKKPLSAHTKLLHHMAMQEMAGSNWQGQARGFRIAPTSRKNPDFHNPLALTRVEGLARAAGIGA